MCRIITVSNMANINPQAASEVAARLVGKTEKDGYGYAILGEKGQFGEKTVDNKFKSRFNKTDFVKNIPITKKYTFFGEFSKPVGPGIFHGRTSTNTRGLLNCHPMLKDGWSLIHNGVVDNLGERYFKETSNDSEDVLFKLIKGISHVEKDLSGYYAFCAIDDKGQLHVARDEYATLFCAWSTKSDTFIFATTEHLVESFCNKLNIKIGPIEEVTENTYFILKGNKVVHLQEIVPLGFTEKQAVLSGASLGRQLVNVKGQKMSEVATDDFEDYIERTFKDEIANMDASYTIYHNKTNDIITVSQYHDLPKSEKLHCEIIRYDGSVVDKNDHEYYRNLLENSYLEIG